MPVAFTKLVFLQEPGRNCQRAAELTLEFDLYLGQHQDRPRFHARLLGISRCTINREPFPAVDLLAGFTDPARFLKQTTSEFLKHAEKEPALYLSQAKPLPPQLTPEIINTQERPLPFQQP